MPSGDPSAQAETLGVAIGPGSPDLLDSPEAGPRALRGGAVRSLGYVAGILLTLASAPLLVRHLGQARFGQYSAVIALTAIVTGLTEGGLNAIALREFSTHSGADRDRLMSNLLGIRLAASVVGIAIAVGFAAIAGYGRELVLGTALAGVGMLFAVTQSLLSVGLQGGLRFGWVAATEFVRQVVTVSLIVAAVLLGSGVVGFLAVAIPAGAFALVATAVLVRRLMPLRPAFDFASWGPLFRDTVPYAVAIALNSLYFRVAIVVMSIDATHLQTGYFATSFRIVEVLIGIPALVIGAAFPILSRAVRDDMDRFAYATGRMFELALVAGAWMVVCVELGAGFAIDVIGGHAAAPAVVVLRIQGFAIAATFVAVAAGFPLLSLRRHRELLIANAAALCAALVLTLILVPAYAARGAAVAAVAAEVALAAVTTLMLVRSVRPVRLPLASAPAILASAGIAVGAGFAMPVHPLLRTVVATVVYAFALRVTGRFPPELRELLAARRAAADLR